jgi:hypothetical protein
MGMIMERNNRDFLDFIVFLFKNWQILLYLLVFLLVSSFLYQNSQKGSYKSDVEIFLLQSHGHYINLNNYLSDVNNFRSDANGPRDNRIAASISVAHSERLISDLLNQKLIVKKLSGVYESQNDGVKNIAGQINNILTMYEMGTYHFKIDIQSDNKEMVSFLTNNVEDQVRKYLKKQYDYIAELALQNALQDLENQVLIKGDDDQLIVKNKINILSAMKKPHVSNDAIEFYSSNIRNYAKYKPVFIYTMSSLIAVLIFFLIVIIKDIKHQISLRER